MTFRWCFFYFEWTIDSCMKHKLIEECPIPRPVRMTVRAKAARGWHLELRSVSPGYEKHAGESYASPRNKRDRVTTQTSFYLFFIYFFIFFFFFIYFMLFLLYRNFEVLFKFNSVYTHLLPNLFPILILVLSADVELTAYWL